MRICVIGNSHTGAIKEGWDRIAADHPGVALQFFAAAGKTMENLHLSEGKLLPGTEEQAESMRLSSGGSTEIMPELYDLFLIVGLGLRTPQLDKRLSRQVCDATFTSLTESTPFRVARMIRSMSAAPVLILPAPLFAKPPSPEEAQDRFIAYYDCLRRIEALVKIDGLRIIPQPEETRSSDWTTAEKWSIGSRRLRGAIGLEPEAAHPEGEFRHMNAEFGQVWLSSVLADIHEHSVRA